MVKAQMIVRSITDSDYKEITDMFVSHSEDRDVLDVASDTGIAVCENDKIVGAAYLYKTNSPISMIDLFIVAKDVSRDMRTKIFDILIQGLVALSQDFGFRYILAEPRFVKSCKRLENHGFTQIKPGSYWLEVQNG